MYAYAAFLGESTEYVLNQVIDVVLARDKEFVAWRVAHPQSCVPSPAGQRRHDAHPSARAAVQPLVSTGARSIS